MSLPFLGRRATSEYLATNHGLEVSEEQLARWAVKGGGPKFRLLGGRKAVYATEDIDVWAADYLGPVIQRMAEHPAQQRSAA